MARWRKLLRRSPADWWLLLRMGVLVLTIRIGLSFFSFKRMRRFIARAGRPSQTPVASDAELARLVWAVGRMSRFILADGPCLTQALTVQLLYGRCGVKTELRIGVAKEPVGELKAHAWVEREGKVIIGGVDSPLRFVPLPSIEHVGL